MPKFSKRIVANIGNYETVALEVGEADSFVECDALLDRELESLSIRHRGVRMQKGVST